MGKNGFAVMDSDMHIMEPPDLWQRYIDPEFREQAPIGSLASVGDLVLLHADGRRWGRAPEAQRPPERQQGKQFALNQQRFKADADRGWTAEVQLEAMDREGIDV